MANKIYIGVVVLVILVSSIYFLLPDKVRIDVQKTKSLYKVYESEKWVLAATEYVNLFDGTAKMRAKNRTLTYHERDGIITIIRSVVYKDHIATIEFYTFDSEISDVKRIPISHQTNCINCIGKILQFEYRDILYNGETKEISSPFKFGHNMELTWEGNPYRVKVYQQKEVDKIILRYRPDKHYQIFETRLFDPPNFGYEGINVTILFPANNTLYVADSIDLNFTVNITANASVYSLDGGANNTDIFDVNRTINITFFNLTEGSHNITIWVNDSEGNIGQSDLLNFSIRPPLNVSLHRSLTGISYNVTWNKTEINYSNEAFWAGNTSWNFTDKNRTISPQVPYLYNITNTRVNNVTVYLNIDRVADYFNWTYNGTQINTTSKGLFNLSPNESMLLNFTLDLINISQIRVNWSLTIDRANWTFVPNFTDVILI